MRTTLPQLALLVLLAVTTARSQGRFTVSVSAAPVYNYNHTLAIFSLSDANGQQVRSQINYQSSGGGYTVGISARYAFTPNWSVSTGIWRNQLRSTQSFPFAPNDIRARVITSGYQIPLLINYKPGTGRLSPYFSVGALGYLYGKTRYKPADGSGLSDVNVKFSNPVNVQAVVGIGASYQLTSHWSLTAQPLLIWRFPPKEDSFVTYSTYISYQVQGLIQLGYTF